MNVLKVDKHDLKNGKLILVEATLREDINGNMFADISKTYNNINKMYLPKAPPCIECHYHGVKPLHAPCCDCGEEHKYFRSTEDVRRVLSAVCNSIVKFCEGLKK